MLYPADVSWGRQAERWQKEQPEELSLAGLGEGDGGESSLNSHDLIMSMGTLPYPPSSLLLQLLKADQRPPGAGALTVIGQREARSQCGNCKGPVSPSTTSLVSSEATRVESEQEHMH